MLRRQILLLGKQKLFLPAVKNIFASRTQILRPKHMFPSLATPGNITRSVISDVRVTWERVSQKLNILTAWRRGPRVAMG